MLPGNYNNARSTVEQAPLFVGQDYHDHADDPMFDEEWRNSKQIQGASGAGMKSNPIFPLKLHYMLSDVEADGLGHIVSWAPHGRCFGVKKQNEFVAQMIPFWFQQTKFPSFQRQLNIYGFKRITAGPDKGCYYHELFLRSKPFLCCRIQRMKLKGNGTRQKSPPESQPNFYSLKFLPPSNHNSCSSDGGGGSSSSSTIDNKDPSSVAAPAPHYGTNDSPPRLRESLIRERNGIADNIIGSCFSVEAWLLQSQRAIAGFSAARDDDAFRVNRSMAAVLSHFRQQRQQLALPLTYTEGDLARVVRVITVTTNIQIKKSRGNTCRDALAASSSFPLTS